MDRIDTRKALFRALGELATCAPADLAGRLDALYAPGAQWRGAHPLKAASGADAIAADIWAPLLRSFPDMERRDMIFVGGAYEGQEMVAALGHYCGTFRRDWLTIPATGGPVFLRYGEVHAVRDGRIVQSTCLWDMLDLMRQAGFWPIAPSLGREGRWSGPITGDGIVLHAADPAEGAASLAQTMAMQGTLGDYDDAAGRGRDGLLAMPQKAHWHPRMMWYGPSGIGTTRGLEGFVDHHQLPFRIAFPKRRGGAQITDRAEGGHYIRIGDGRYSVTGGWPSVRANHLGGGFLGVGPTGRPIRMRVMDFYLHHEGLIRENWVPLDVLDVLRQMGVDVLARMQSQFRRGARTD